MVMTTAPRAPADGGAEPALDTAQSVRLLLRTATRPYHDRVDASFGAFSLSERERYIHFLRAHARILPRAEAVTKPGELLDHWSGRTAALAADLAQLDIAMPDSVAFDLPAGAAARWGAIYVIEGSRLGGAMLSKSVPDGLPSAYLSAVHGPGGWQRIIDALDRADGGAAWREQAVAGAKAMFEAYIAAANAERVS